ncbi:MAG: hypothetical protein ACRD1Z_04390 [Vicinamibacteria bacterium]
MKSPNDPRPGPAAPRPEETFTVRILSSEREVEDAVAHLLARTRRFVEEVVERPVRSVSVDTSNLDQLSFRNGVLKSIALQMHFRPEETRTYKECYEAALRDHGLRVERWIDENLDLLAEVKFGREARP